MYHPSLAKYAWLAIAAAVTTMAMKVVASWMTGSVSLLSDALESGVNLLAAVLALVALRAADGDPDENFAYGKAKAEYLSAGIEGTMIVVAAIAILTTALPRLISPTEIERAGIGVVISLIAGAINLGVAVVLTRAGRRYRSIALEADGKHLMTDVWSSAAVGIGVIVVAVTGWIRLDPIIAILAAIHIVVSGLFLMKRSVYGLLDARIPDDDLDRLNAILDRHRSAALEFHAVMTRQAGQRAFMSFHVLVPGSRTITSAHNQVEAIEAELRAAVPHLHVVTHIEPLEDPRSFTDLGLERVEP